MEPKAVALDGTRSELMQERSFTLLSHTVLSIYYLMKNIQPAWAKFSYSAQRRNSPFCRVLHTITVAHQHLLEQ